MRTGRRYHQIPRQYERQCSANSGFALLMIVVAIGIAGVLLSVYMRDVAAHVRGPGEFRWTIQAANLAEAGVEIARAAMEARGSVVSRECLLDGGRIAVRGRKTKRKDGEAYLVISTGTHPARSARRAQTTCRAVLWKDDSGRVQAIVFREKPNCGGASPGAARSRSQKPRRPAPTVP